MEWLWKLLRPEIISATFYRTRGQLRQAFLAYFFRVDEPGHKPASLLTLNFHLLDS